MAPEVNTKLISDFFNVVGQVTVAFGQLEGALAQEISFLVSTDAPIGDILTAGMSFQGKVDAFAAIIKHRTSNKHVLAELQHLLKTVTKICEQRNAVVHSQIFPDTLDPNYLIEQRKITVRGGKGLVDSTKKYPLSELRELGSSIILTTFTLRDFMRRHRELYASNDSKKTGLVLGATKNSYDSLRLKRQSGHQG